MTPYHITAPCVGQAFGSCLKPQCRVVFEAVDPSKMAPTSMSNTNKVFHNLHMLWMCIWVTPYHMPAPCVGQALGSSCLAISGLLRSKATM